LTSFESYSNSPFRSVKHSTYFATYDALFGKFRGKKVTFAEIGVLGGGSLFMWRDFFGPEARIIGIDLNPSAKKWEKDGFEIFIGDQSDPDFWKTLQSSVGSVDVLLDDGGHTYLQQISTVQNGLDLIKDGGLLVVEDTHTSYMDGFGSQKFSFMKWVYKQSDEINSRFGELDGAPTSMTRQIWSMRIFESFVAFEVNRELCSTLSHPTENGGVDDLAEDFRYFDRSKMSGLLGLISQAGAKLKISSWLPGYKLIGNVVFQVVTRGALSGRKELRKAFWSSERNLK
jgi:hypothetical protein